MSEKDGIIILFISTVVFWVFSLSVCILLKECLVGMIANPVIAVFWYHLWCLKREKRRNEENISYWK